MKYLAAIFLALYCLNGMAQTIKPPREFKWRQLQRWPDTTLTVYIDDNSITQHGESISSGTFAIKPKMPIVMVDGSKVIAVIRVAMIDCSNNMISLVADVFFSELKGKLPTLDDKFATTRSYQGALPPLEIDPRHPAHVTLCRQMI